MRDELRRAALVTSGVVDLTRQKAEQVVKELVKSGYIRSEQTSGAVKELLKRSDTNRKEITRFIRSELKNQIEGLGLATKRDLERLERKVARLEEARKSANKSKKKTTAKKSTASSKGSGSSGTKSSGGSGQTDPKGSSSGENRASQNGEG